MRSRTFLDSGDVRALVNAPLSSCHYFARGGDDMTSTDRSDSDTHSQNQNQNQNQNQSHIHSFSENQYQNQNQNDCQSATTSDSFSVSNGSQYTEYNQSSRRITDEPGCEYDTVGFSDSESDTNMSESELNKDSLLLLQESITLYLEPRLLRIQPPETLDLRALAFLISARTAVKSISRQHLSSSTISTINQKPSHLTGINNDSYSKGILKNKNRAVTSRKEDGLLTLKDLKMIVEGGRYFLAMREDTLKKNREVKDLIPDHGSIGSVECSAASEMLTGTDTAFNGSLAVSKVLESGDLVSDIREKLYNHIEGVTVAVADRFTMCLEALTAALSVKRNRTPAGCDSGLWNVGCDTCPVDSLYDHPYSTLALSIAHSTGPNRSQTSPLDLHRVDMLLEEAGQGMFLEEEYAFARLKNMLLPSMRDCKSNKSDNGLLQSDKDICFSKNSNAPVVSDSRDSVGRIHGSSAILSEVKQYCWCRGADDGSPMVQCDGCDEWFHSSCMGLTKQKATAPKGSGVGAGSGRDTVKGEFSVPSIITGKVKSKTKGAVIKTTKQLQGVVDICFYCIACTEDMGETYPHRWASDFY